MKTLSMILSFVLCVLSTSISFGQETFLVEKRLTDLLKESYSRTEIQVKLESAPAHLKYGVKIKSVSVNREPELGGKGLAVVGFEGDDGKMRVSYVPFRVYEKRRLFYSNKALPKGSPISVDDLGTKETYVGDTELIYPKSMPDVIGKILKKDVAAGTILTTPILDSPQVIRRGETVFIVSENRQLLVRTKGKAEESGKVGQKIRVRNLSSDREVVGRVAGDGTVVVEF